MIAFLKLYWATILICIGLFAILFAIVWKRIDNKKKGKSSCGCGCQNCAMSELCHKKK